MEKTDEDTINKVNAAKIPGPSEKNELGDLKISEEYLMLLKKYKEALKEMTRHIKIALVREGISNVKNADDGKKWKINS